MVLFMVCRNMMIYKVLINKGIFTMFVQKGIMMLEKLLYQKILHY